MSVPLFTGCVHPHSDGFHRNLKLGYRRLLRSVIRTAVSNDCASFSDASFLHCMRAAFPTHLNSADPSSFFVQLLLHMSFPCHFRTLLLFTCPDDSSLCLVLHAGVPTLLNSAVIRLHSCSPFFSLTWQCASWSAGTTRLRHVRKDRLVFMSGGAFELSLPLLAPFPRVLLTTAHHESSRCGLGLLRYTGYPGVPLVLSTSSAPASARSLGSLLISSMYCI